MNGVQVGGGRDVLPVSKARDAPVLVEGALEHVAALAPSKLLGRDEARRLSQLLLSHLPLHLVPLLLRTRLLGRQQREVALAQQHKVAALAHLHAAHLDRVPPLARIVPQHLARSSVELRSALERMHAHAHARLQGLVGLGVVGSISVQARALLAAALGRRLGRRLRLLRLLRQPRLHTTRARLRRPQQQVHARGRVGRGQVDQQNVCEASGGGELSGVDVGAHLPPRRALLHRRAALARAPIAAPHALRLHCPKELLARRLLLLLHEVGVVAVGEDAARDGGHGDRGRVQVVARRQRAKARAEDLRPDDAKDQVLLRGKVLPCGADGVHDVLDALRGEAAGGGVRPSAPG